MDDVIRDQSKKQRSRLNSLTHGLRAVNALIEAFKIIKTEIGCRMAEGSAAPGFIMHVNWSADWRQLF